MHNRVITELEENTFANITFNIIQIYSAHNLKRIHLNAFIGTHKTVTEIHILYDIINLENLPPNYDVFYELNTRKCQRNRTFFPKDH